MACPLNAGRHPSDERGVAIEDSRTGCSRPGWKLLSGAGRERHASAIMAKFYTELTGAQCEFILRQKIFFVASAPGTGRVNLSPKGMTTLRVLNPHRVAYLDATGSGNETAAHLAENGRITLMFCAFADAPLILRLYGRGQAVRPRDSAWSGLRPLFGPFLPGERQLIVTDIESVQTSCGFAVPFFEYQGERGQLIAWAEKKGTDGVAAYWAEKNTRSIDGLPTGLLDP
jgi:hypothetical protein